MTLSETMKKLSIKKYAFVASVLLAALSVSADPTVIPTPDSGGSNDPTVVPTLDPGDSGDPVVTVEKPVLKTDGDECDAAVEFRIENYDAALQYNLPAGFERTDNVIRPSGTLVLGTTYSLQVTATDPVSLVESEPSDEVQRIYLLRPVHPVLSQNRIANDRVEVSIQNYDATDAYTYVYNVNGGADQPYTAPFAVTLPAGQTQATALFGVNKILRVNGQEYCAAGYVDQPIDLIADPQTPQITTQSGCGKAVVFTLANPEADCSYVWTVTENGQNAMQVTPIADQYTVQNPRDGAVYEMTVTATRTLNALSATATGTASQTYQQFPADLSSVSHRVCQQAGASLQVETLVTGATHSLKWFDAAGGQIFPPVVDLSVADTHTFYVVQKDSKGCESENRALVEVKVVEIPKVQMPAELWVCASSTNTPIQVQALTAAAASYEWSGTYVNFLSDAHVANPMFTPANVTQDTDCNYTLAVTSLENNQCSTQYTYTAHVLEQPTVKLAGISGNSIAACVGESLTLSIENPTPGVVYEWTDPDGVLSQLTATSWKISSLQAPTNLQVQAKRTAQGQTCLSDPYSLAITVVEGPSFVATTAPNNTLTACEGTVLTLGGDNPDSQFSYTWTPTVGLSSATEAKPTVTVSSEITYTLSVGYKNGPTCQSQSSVTIKPIALPTKFQLVPEGATEFCSLSPSTGVKLSGSESNVIYSLYNNGTLVSSQNGTGLPLRWDILAEGRYTVKAELSNSGITCQQDMDGEVVFTAKPSPEATLSLAAGDVACPNSTVSVEVKFTGTSPFEATLWQDGNLIPIRSNSDTYVHQHVVSGSTSFKLLDVKDNVCSTVYAAGTEPVLDITAPDASSLKIHSDNPNNKLCQGVKESITLSVPFDETLFPDSKIIWGTGDEGKNLVVNPQSTTEYKVFIYTNNNQCVSEDAITIVVVDSTEITIEMDTFYCENAGLASLNAYPVGGTFVSEDGLIVNTNVLDPSLAPAPGSYIISYQYSKDGCPFKKNDTIYIGKEIADVNWGVYPVHEGPIDQITDIQFCLPNIDTQKEVLKLQGYPPVENGVRWELYARNGSQVVTSDAVLEQDPNSPWLATLKNMTAGLVYEIAYSVPDQFGCVTKKSHKVQLNLNPTSRPESGGLIVMNRADVVTSNLCTTDKVATIKTGNVIPVKAVSFSDSRFLNDAPASDYTNGIIRINPSSVGIEGTYSAIFTYEYSVGCSFSERVDFHLGTATQILNFNLKKSYCVYDENEYITVSTATPTTGDISIFKIEDDGTKTHVVGPINMVNNPQFTPSAYLPGKYRVIYDYMDVNGTCVAADSVEVMVYDRPTISFDFAQDFCMGEVFALKTTPTNGTWKLNNDERHPALINGSMYTQQAGIGRHELEFSTTDPATGCANTEIYPIEVHGTDPVLILNLKERYCSPQDIVTISGSPITPGTGVFRGCDHLDFITNLGNNQASIDLSKGNYNTTYTVYYDYTQEFQPRNGGAPMLCTSTAEQNFSILGKGIDFNGIEHNAIICSYDQPIELAATESQNVTFTFNGANATAFVDNGDGTAVIYPEKLQEGIYTITADYQFIENGELICSSSKTKSFTIVNIEKDIAVELFCDFSHDPVNGNNAVRLLESEPDINYQLWVGGQLFDTQKGDGNNLEFPPIAIEGPAEIIIKGTYDGCLVTLDMPQALSVQKLRSSLESQQISCFGKVDGLIKANVQGGVTPYQLQEFTFTPENSTTSTSIASTLITNGAAGTYEFLVKDKIGCSHSRRVVIEEPTQLQAQLQAKDADCAGESTGQAVLTVTGGSPTYSYKWVNKENPSDVLSSTHVFENIEQGQYTWQVTDVRGCELSDDFTIYAPEQALQLTENNAEHVDVTLTGAATGIIEVAAAGGTPFDDAATPYYKYTWVGNSFPTNLTTLDARQENLLAGIYYITVEDKRGCTKTISVTITQPEVISITPQVIDVACRGEETGSILLTITGGKLPYRQMEWFDESGNSLSQDNPNLQGYKAGIYKFVMEDANGNRQEQTYRILEPDNVLSVLQDNASDLTVSCYGKSDATIKLAITGGTAFADPNRYKVTWQTLNDPANQLLADDYTRVVNLPAGTYGAEVEDANGCKSIVTDIVVSQPAEMRFVDVVTKSVRCSDGADGSIEVTVSGGNVTSPADYTYQWTGQPYLDASSQLAPNHIVDLHSGSYTVRVTDQTQECFIEKTIELDSPVLWEVAINATPISCAGRTDGTLTAVISGGAATSYTYQWLDASDNVISSAVSMTGVAAGDYKVKVTDDRGCERLQIASLSNPQPLKIDDVKYTDITCHNVNDASVTVEVSGGSGNYTYNWTNGGNFVASSQTVQNLPMGSYQVEVADQNFPTCIVRSGVTEIKNPDPVSYTVLTEDVAIVGDRTGRIVVTPQGGRSPYYIVWTGAPEGVTIADDLFDVNNLPAGNYYFEVFDNRKQCSAVGSVTLKQPDPMQVTVAVTNVTCHGAATGKLEVTDVQGGDGTYTYKWYENQGGTPVLISEQTLAQGLSADVDYTLEVADGSGNVDKTNYKLTQPKNPLQVSVDTYQSQTEVTCKGDKDAFVRIIATGGTADYTYQWDDPTLTIDPVETNKAKDLGVGRYTVLVQDANGCTAPFGFNISGPAQDLTINETIEHIKCHGDENGTIELHVSGGNGGYTYEWTGDAGIGDPNSPLQNTLLGGKTYRVVVADSKGCSDSRVYTMQDRTPLQVNVTTTDLLCFEDGKGGFDASIRSSIGETHKLIYLSSPLPTDMGSITTANNLSAGDYKFVVEDDNNCLVEVPFTIAQPNELTVSIEGSDKLCDGIDNGVMDVKIPVDAGTPNYTYKWFKEDEHMVMIHQPQMDQQTHLTEMGAGRYRLEVVDANGCKAETNHQIKASTPMKFTKVEVTHIAIHGDMTGEVDIEVTGGDQPLSYIWASNDFDFPAPYNPNAQDQTQLPAGRYTVSVIDNISCQIDSTVDIMQPESMVVTPLIHDINCAGDKGAISLRVEGGYQPYHYTWTYPDGTVHAATGLHEQNNLPSGKYSIQVRDDKNNTVNTTVVLNDPTPVTWSLRQEFSKLALDCYESSNGAIELFIEGGSGSYSVLWEGPGVMGKTGESVKNLGAGQYKATIKDSKGCVPTQEMLQEITRPAAPLQVVATIENNTCYGDEKANIQLAVSGGTPLPAPDEYIYTWSGYGVDVTAKDQQNLTADDYKVTVKDANGCTVEKQFTLVDPVANTAALTGNGVVCEGEKVKLYINVSGQGPWEVTYTDGYQLYTDTYTDRIIEIEYEPTRNCTIELVEVKDNLGCLATLTGTVPIEVYAVPELSVVSYDKDCCLGGSANINLLLANEGGWKVTYEVDGQTIESGLMTDVGSSLVITPLQPGTKTYTLKTVSNAHCSRQLVDMSYEITTYERPSLQVNIPAEICEPNALPVELHALGSAPWTVRYSMNGLEHVEEMTTPEETITFDAYEDDNTFVFHSITSGTRCETTVNRTHYNHVNRLPLQPAAIVGDNNVCRGSMAQIMVDPVAYAESYDWTLPQGFTIVSGTGTEQITVEVGEDAVSGDITVFARNACGEGLPTTRAIKVVGPVNNTGKFKEIPSHICERGELFPMSLEAPVQGATAYEWILPAGYSLDGNTNETTSIDVLVRYNEYAQSGIIQVIPKNGCYAAAPITANINLRPLPNAEAGVDFVTLNCATSARLNATPISGNIAPNGWTQEWTVLSGTGTLADATNPTTEVDNLLFGPNRFEWMVNDGYCINTDVVTVTSNNPGITQPEATDITVCEDFVTLRAPAPLYGTGSWRLIAGDGELLTPTSNVTDVLDLSRRTPNKFLWEVSYAECTNAVEVQVVSNSLQSLADAGEDGVTTNGMFRLSAKSFDSSSITGEWTVVGGSGEFADPTSPNTYVTGLSQGINTFRWTLKGYDCEAYDDVQVRSADEPVAGFNMVNDKGCEPLTVLFNNITLGDATYHWDFGDGTASTLRSPEHIFEKAGVYKVTLTATGKYRTDKTEQYVTVLSSPTAAFTVSSTQLYVPNAEAHFYNSSDRVEEYYWDFGDGHSSTEKDPVHMYYEDGEYDITYIVTDLNGCKDTLTYENYIHVGKGSFIVFPTAFTPNLEQQLDGRYEAEERRLDIFYPVSRNVDTYRLEVYNQWGNMVFVTEDLYEGWNGYYLDQPAAQGTYVYKAEGRFRDGTAFRQGGSILLIR